MFRRRGLNAAIVFTLALGLAGAPAALAAGPTDVGPGGLWAALQSWAQEVVDWFGWGESEQTQEVTYQASDCPEDEPLCGGDGPLPTGGEPGSTTDDGPFTDPDG